MDNREEQLQQLHSLQQLQNAQLMEGRVKDLEESVSALSSVVNELKKDFALLLMEFNRDHIKLGAQDAPYRNKE